MNKSFVNICFCIILCVMCKSPSSQTSQDNRAKNHLKNETSPYLLQHVYNPVDWHPWTPETLAKAKNEGKLLLISVGYSACHWCHVMEHESFEDSTVAAIMNQHFIPVKVDREERPDVDDVYMTACQLVSKKGCGWPLNAFALPDGRPFWAGTYFPKEEWINILKHFSSNYAEKPDEFITAAQNLTEGIQQSENLIDLASTEIISNNQLHNLASKYIDLEDRAWGGRQGSPKFPMPDNYLFLLRQYQIQPSDQILRYINNGLTKMAYGGIYDQIGGGFARYSVDEKWLAPHFEKMLYDNGQLVQVYAEAYALTKDPLYKSVVEETLEFIKRELTDKSGGFYSALDADSEGEEGKFYVWTSDDINKIITDPETNKLYRTYYSISDKGNWEHGNNILFRQKSTAEIAKAEKISEAELEKRISKADKQLLKARSKRIRPGLDDKVLTSWNALMLKGYVAAYIALGNDDYLKTALTNAQFIFDNQIDESGRLNRNYKNGRSTINAYLDDYALLIDAYLELYQATLDQQWLDNAKKLADYTMIHFYDDKTGYFFYTSDLDDPLITRKKEINDNVIPASNSVMGVDLYKLGQLYDDRNFIDISRKMAQGMSGSIIKSNMPHFYSQWLQLILRQNYPSKEIAIVGPDAKKILRSLRTAYYPNPLFLGSEKENDLPLLQQKYMEGETFIYVCQNKVCKLPTTDIDQAVELINSPF